MKRQNLSQVFGDETYKDKNIIENDEKEKESAEKETEESKAAQEKPESEDQSANKVGTHSIVTIYCSRRKCKRINSDHLNKSD